MEFTWKILKVFADDEVITSVQYGLSATDGTNTVETEGYHTFKEGVVNVPYADIKEYNLTDWLNNDTSEAIKMNLEQQLNSLKTPKNTKLPWLADTFTPN